MSVCVCVSLCVCTEVCRYVCASSCPSGSPCVCVCVRGVCVCLYVCLGVCECVCVCALVCLCVCVLFFGFFSPCPHLLFLACLGDKQGKPQTKNRIFLFAEPPKILRKKGKTLKKTRNSLQKKRARITPPPPKSKKEDRGNENLAEHRGNGPQTLFLSHFCFFLGYFSCFLLKPEAPNLFSGRPTWSQICHWGGGKFNTPPPLPPEKTFLGVGRVQQGGGGRRVKQVQCGKLAF